MDNYIIEKLMLLGLDEREAQIYLELLRQGPMSAGRLASELGLSRIQVYRCARRMVERGILSIQLSKPQRLVASPIQRLIEDRTGELKARLRVLEEGAKEIEEALRGLPGRGHEGVAYTFRLIEGRRNAYAAMCSAAGRARERIAVALDGDDVMLASLEGLDDALLAAAERGVKIRMLTQITPFNSDAVRRLLSGFGVRHSPNRVGRVMIVDGRECFVSLVLRRDRPDEEMGLWTDGAHFVGLMERSFDDAFEHSEDGGEVLGILEARMGNYRLYNSMVELVRQRLTELGYRVEAPATVRGSSGFNHEVTLRVQGPAGETLVAELCLSKLEMLDAQGLMGSIVKLVDISPATKVLVAVPGIDQKAADLCRFLGIHVIAGEPTSAADQLIQSIRHAIQSTTAP